MDEVTKYNSFKAINITYNPEKIFFTSDLHFFSQKYNAILPKTIQQFS